MVSALLLGAASRRCFSGVLLGVDSLLTIIPIKAPDCFFMGRDLFLSHVHIFAYYLFSFGYINCSAPRFVPREPVLALALA